MIWVYDVTPAVSACFFVKKPHSNGSVSWQTALA